MVELLEQSLICYAPKQLTQLILAELRLAQMRGLARFILDSADEIDLLLRRRRDAMQLEATAVLREFAHAAE